MKILRFQDYTKQLLILEKLDLEKINKKLSQYMKTSDNEIINNKLKELQELTTNETYVMWLVELYSKGNLKEEDFYKAKEYLEIFTKNKINPDMKEKNIFNIKTLPDLYKNIKDHIDFKSKSNQIKNVKNNEAEKYEFTDWTIVIPKTEEAAKFYGKGTQWCTSGDTNNQYKNYTENGKFLFIFIHKTEKLDGYQLKYQLWLNDDIDEPSQFMDVYDESEEPRDIIPYELFQWCMKYQGYNEIPTEGIKFYLDDMDKFLSDEDLKLTDIQDIIELGYDQDTRDLSKETIIEIFTQLEDGTSNLDFYEYNLSEFITNDIIEYLRDKFNITNTFKNVEEFVNFIDEDLNINIRNLSERNIESIKNVEQGKYFRWLILRYKDNIKLLVEDFEKIYKYLKLFDENKFKIKADGHNIDILSYKTKDDLYKVIEKYDISETEFTNEDEKKLAGEFKQVFQNDYCRIIIPETLEASKYFAQGTEWCTRFPNNFRDYTRQQDSNTINEYNLYIIYTEKHTDRLQFHFRERQFMNVKDSAINILNFFNEHKDIHNFFKNIKNLDIYINPVKIINAKSLNDLPEIIEGSLDLYFAKLTSLEGAPKIVRVDFSCASNKLTSLEHCPNVGENLICNYNKIESLLGCQKIIKGDFACDSNLIKSLEFGPEVVEGNFNCTDNKLTSLIHSPKVGYNYDCGSNDLITLKGIQKIINGSLDCFDNKLTTFADGPTEIKGKLEASKNSLTTLEHLPRVGSDISLRENLLKSLLGCQKVVKGDFFISHNMLSTLEFGPEEVYGSFECTNNYLSTLEFAPKIVKGDFDCTKNPNLSEAEILKYSLSRAVEGKIHSDYGTF
jgi:hypothetical protein